MRFYPEDKVEVLVFHDWLDGFGQTFDEVFHNSTQTNKALLNPICQTLRLLHPHQKRNQYKLGHMMNSTNHILLSKMVEQTKIQILRSFDEYIIQNGNYFLKQLVI